MDNSLENSLEKIKTLKGERDKVLNKIKRIDSIFEEEKDNEECWPGHSSTRYQTADVERQVLAEHLHSIEKAIELLTADINK